MTGCVNRRSTRTITVLSCLSLTTTPWRVRFGILKSSLRLGCGLALLPGDGLDARDVAPHRAHARGVLELAGGALETQVELLLLQLQHLIVELIDGQSPHVF